MSNLKPGLINGWLFMSVFILQMIGMMFADKQVQERTHIPADANRSKREKSVSIIANGVWLIGLIYSVFLPLRLESFWFYVGLFVFVIGLAFLVLATHSFMTTPIDELITKGIYQLSRHPMYTATFLIFLGTGIAAKDWLFILLSIMIAFCFREEALLEEKICLEQYGNVYWEYMHKVQMWFGIPGQKF
jgi:protein-S-isoprenylcysteine O-methyltransferase Ste14